MTSTPMIRFRRLLRSNPGLLIADVEKLWSLRDLLAMENNNRDYSYYYSELLMRSTTDLDRDQHFSNVSSACVGGSDDEIVAEIGQ